MAASEIACAAVLANEDAELVAEATAASRADTARASSAVESVPRNVPSRAVSEASCTAGSVEEFDGSVANVSADTAALPTPATALPNRLNADTPTLIKIDVGSSGGGGSGNSSCFALRLVSDIPRGWSSTSPSCGLSNATLIELGSKAAGAEGVSMSFCIGAGGPNSSTDVLLARSVNRLILYASTNAKDETLAESGLRNAPPHKHRCAQSLLNSHYRVRSW